jgi:hypothetical protein
MIEPDLHVTGLLQGIRDRAGLVVARKTVGQHRLVDHALVLLEIRHMSIAEHRETVGREREAAPHGVQARSDGLVRQPVDQVEVDPLDPGAAEHVDHGSRLLEALHAVDRPLHDGIEALHAEAGAVDAGQPHGLDHIGGQCARIDLDRDFGRRQYEELLTHRRHQFDEGLRRHDRRRTAAEMDVLDLDATADGLGGQRDLAAQRPLVAGDQLVAAGDLGMAAAVPAHLAAERHVQVK